MTLTLRAVPYLAGVVKILQDYEETGSSTTSTLVQVGGAGLGALIGAFFGEFDNLSFINITKACFFPLVHVSHCYA